jgi:hypothetical protein
MATYSSNTTLKANAAVASTQTITTTNSSTTASATVYTAPASSYSLVQIWYSGAFNGGAVGTMTMTVGGRTIYTATASATGLIQVSVTVGPSQSVVISTSQGTAAGTNTSFRCDVSGVNLINTP